MCWGVRLRKEHIKSFRAAGAEGPGYKVTWTNDRSIDWPAVAAELDPAADLVAAHTHVDWKAVAETLRPKPAVIAAHAAPGARSLRVRETGDKS
jgi:hypothetical protein